jgi:hypothetical protein
MRRRVRKVIGWGVVVLVAVVIGGGWFAYAYVTDNETLRTAILDGAPRFLPACLVDVHRVRVHPFTGQIEITSVSIRKVEEGKPNPMLVGTSPWVQISCDPWAVLDGRFELKEVVVAQPRLRLRRRKDGSWNFQGLLANPWPMPPSETTPPIRIENGTVELVDESDGPDVAPAAILRDVSVKINPGDMQGTPIRFEGKARGDLYESFKLEGAIDRKTGRVMLSGDLTRLALSKTLGDRLPAEARTIFRKLGLIGGEVDATLRSLTYDPKAAVPIHYDAKVQIRSGVWACEKLPFPVNELSAVVVLRDGKAIVEHSEGRNGPTTARATGEIVLGELTKTPFHLELEAEGVEIDNRLRDWMFVTFDKVGPTLWRDFDPSGRVNLSADLDRTAPGRPIDWKVAVNCLDVALTYREFRYPLEHVMGEVVASPLRVDIDLHTLSVGGKPLTAKGSVDQPATSKIVDLDFTAQALPVDKTLLEAMPPDVKHGVELFKPAGMVRGKAHIRRTPPVLPSDPAKGVITFTADLDLNPGCEITWDGLKYPVRDLTGHLEIRPSSWIFREMRGTHGQAAITGEGRVDSLANGERKVGLHVHADNLLFESQLRDALRPAWQKAWDKLNPTGASDVDVKINMEPGGADHYHLEIIPRPQTNLRLKFERIAVEGDGGGSPMIEMPMEDVRGLFVFNDGVVTMRGGRFSFRNAPVKFDWGEVRVHDTGEFSLKIGDLCVEDFRIDHGLRQLMPPVMAKFARRLDDGKTFRIRTDLALGWSGKLNELATCAWENGLVVFLDNSIEAGLMLKHLQGQIDHLHGSFNGRDLEVGGALALDSISLFDIQVTNLASPIELKDGKARLTQIRGTLMKGQITGRLEVALDATPKFETRLAIEGADLESYARSLVGKQDFRGLLSGEIELSGQGGDPHTYQGRGRAQITRGDLGKLPAWALILKVLNLAGTAKTAFDRAEVVFTVRNGQTSLDPVEFFGDAFSLHGRGTMDVQGELNVPLRVLYSRDTWHIPGFSDMIREMEGQILVLRVSGTVAAPDYKPELFPAAGEFARSLGDRRATRMPRDRNMPRLPFSRPRRGDDDGP